MNLLIPWSSGLDSTYLVAKMLWEGNTVYAPYFELVNNAGKVKAEKVALELLKEHSFFKTFLNNGRLIQWNAASLDLQSSPGSGWRALDPIQAVAWQGMIAVSLVPNIDKVMLAYVLNDCAVSYQDELKAIWKAYGGFSRHGQTHPELEFPLRKLPKQSIAYYLDGLALGAKELTWTCENPKDEKPCLECDTCKRSPLLPLKPYEPQLHKSLDFEVDIDYLAAEPDYSI